MNVERLGDRLRLDPGSRLIRTAVSLNSRLYRSPCVFSRSRRTDLRREA